MTAVSYGKAKNRRSAGAFAPIPVSVLNHPNFTNLSPKAVKLLMDVVAQVRFKTGGPVNNGDLAITWTILELRGWVSRETLRNAKAELEYYEFITQTRQGGRHRCSLFAVTWWSIDECDGKLDVKMTAVAPNSWQSVKTKYVPQPRRKMRQGNTSRDTMIRFVNPDSRVNRQFTVLTIGEIYALCPDDRASELEMVAR